MKKWLKRFLKSKSKSKKKNIFEQIQGAELNELEVKQWLINETTLKMLRVLKFHKREFTDALVKQSFTNDKDIYLLLGRCKGYDDIIELLEETAANPEDLKAIIETFIISKHDK